MKSSKYEKGSDWWGPWSNVLYRLRSHIAYKRMAVSSKDTTDPRAVSYSQSYFSRVASLQERTNFKDVRTRVPLDRMK